MKPSYLSYLKQALKGMSSFNELYRLYTDTMGKDPLTEAFFWIIDEEPLSEGTMKLVMEKADVSAFIKYYFSTDKLYYSMDLIPPKEMLDEEAYQLLADEQRIYEGPFISPVSTEYTSDTVIQAIDAAVRELQDPAADFTKADDEDGPLAFIYSRIELFAQREELKESLTALHRAYYERLLKEEYPVYLINALGLGNAADSFLYILNELYPGQGANRITEWAETVYQKADPSDQRPEQLPVDLLITAVNEFAENNDTDSLFEAAELLTLKYDQIGYFHKDCWERMTEALKDQFPDETYPLFYCTPNTQMLYETYRRYGNDRKAANLFARLDAYIPEIVSWAEKNNEDTQEFIRDFFRHIRQERWLRYPYTNETLVQHFYDRQLAKIRSFLETADRQSDYQMLQQLMEDYLYYDACLNDPDSLQRHASELIQMIRGCEENADSDTKEILEAEVQYVQDKQNEYMHGEPETIRF